MLTGTTTSAVWATRWHHSNWKTQVFQETFDMGKPQFEYMSSPKWKYNKMNQIRKDISLDITSVPKHNLSKTQSFTNICDWPFSKVILYLSKNSEIRLNIKEAGRSVLTICWYRQREICAPYHCMSDDNSARLQTTHYNHYFKEGKRPMAHILSLPLYPVTVWRKQTKTTVVNAKKQNNPEIKNAMTK